MNRSIPPPSGSIDRIHITKAETIQLRNGINLHCIDSGTSGIVQFEIILRSGKWFEKANGISYFTSKMISEGTSNMTSSEISGFFDSYGALFKITPGIDLVTVTSVFLDKHFGMLIPVIAECLFESSFPETELNILKDLQIQEIRVNNERGAYTSIKEFKKQIFGKDHPYGRSLEIEDINETIIPSRLKGFHSAVFLNGMELILTGSISGEMVQTIGTEFGERNTLRISDEGIHAAEKEIKETRLNIPRAGSLQTSVRYGKKTIRKDHPDYPGFMVLNELLGGFFGSRLMKNIREDKGFTYGIYSSVVSYLYDSFFVISADLMKEFTERAIEEINYEIKRLQSEPVKQEEMNIVRNYMLGSFLSSIETPFSLAEKFRSVYFYGLDYDFYDRFIHTLNTIQPENIQRLAEKYLNIDEFTLVTVGDIREAI